MSELGRLVRHIWVQYCLQTGDTKPSHIADYDALSDWDKGADQAIGMGVAEYVMQGAQETIDFYRLECLYQRYVIALFRIGTITNHHEFDVFQGKDGAWYCIDPLHHKPMLLGTTVEMADQKLSELITTVELMINQAKG